MYSEDLDSFAFARDVTALAISASSWTDEAMKAWASGDFAKVGLMAPVAVEHLGKAVLWNKNPVLLVQLNPNDEGSLFALATAPNLGLQTLRTVGLTHVVNRVEKVLGGGPVLLKADRDRMVQVRNGITHVGTAELSRHVLLDSLKFLNVMLANLRIGQKLFYGVHARHVTELLDEKKSAVGHEILERRAAARQRVNGLRHSLGETAFTELVERVEATRSELDGPAYRLGVELLAMDWNCPECLSVGRVFGYIELEEQVDFDVEPLGGGKYASTPVGYWDIWFTPQGFECAVCRLFLVGSEELTEVDLDIDKRRADPEDFGDDFDLDEVVHNLFGPDFE